MTEINSTLQKLLLPLILLKIISTSEIFSNFYQIFWLRLSCRENVKCIFYVNEEPYEKGVTCILAESKLQYKMTIGTYTITILNQVVSFCCQIKLPHDTVEGTKL